MKPSYAMHRRSLKGEARGGAASASAAAATDAVASPTSSSTKRASAARNPFQSLLNKPQQPTGGAGSGGIAKGKKSTHGTRGNHDVAPPTIVARARCDCMLHKSIAIAVRSLTRHVCSPLGGINTSCAGGCVLVVERFLCSGANPCSLCPPSVLRALCSPGFSQRSLLVYQMTLRPSPSARPGRGRPRRSSRGSRCENIAVFLDS